MAVVLGAVCLGLLSFQGTAALILLARLLRGPARAKPLAPKAPTPAHLGAVSVVVPTLNEVHRIGPCLAGLSRQSYEVREIAIVDSHSQDGTREKVKTAGQRDPRIRLLTDTPLPAGWVGRPWALDYGFRHTAQKSQWFLGIDADTEPQPGLVTALLAAAEGGDYDLISLAPQFILYAPGEWWLQPALLMTLLYRFEAAGLSAQVPERVMANGQCFLCRRSVLEQVDGYASAARSFCDDVTLARNIAKRGFKVGFLDGSRLLKVRMYEGALETWQEWGRSLDLKDAAAPGQLGMDLWLLASVQGLPLLLSLVLGVWLALGYDFLTLRLALGLNLFLMVIRWALLLAILPAYDRQRGGRAFWLFWLSPLADPLAVLRIFLSAARTPTQWRGRSYESLGGH
ncbi:MAG: glycosyltransferase [Chloroflexaceae bacterium]|nr:glycosyltransferase [Chloroflexaceae bacterium]